MSIITKPYSLSIWKDQLVEGVLTETKICEIGSDKMSSQNKAFGLNLVRNVNGQKKLTFKMYKQYIDNITGEKTHNLFTDLLQNETKIKLYYENKWYDFVIKNISENSASYLCTYQLEDALVQELSKNGFGITLDADLMNNLGTAKELAEYTLSETDWDVESEVFVQTVEEALVYVSVPAGTKAKHIKDQVKDADGKYSVGVTDEDFTFTSKSTILAFYSSCTNRPHRFQFIYSSEGYGKNSNDDYKIGRKDDRTINEADCQYYIDFSSEADYVDPIKSSNSTIKNLGLWLPTNFTIGDVGTREGDPNDKDSYLSSWYRGKRYGFAQQAVYVPVLEKYCQKFTRNEPVGKDAKWKLHQEGDGNNIFGDLEWNDSAKAHTIKNGSKSAQYSGHYLDYDYNSQDTYIIDYKLTVTGGTLTRIGGHNEAFATGTKFQVKYGNTVLTTKTSYVDIGSITAGGSITVHAEYSNYNSKASSPWIFIQPNRGLTTSVQYNITDLKVTIRGNYLGYTDSEFISPTFIQNNITNYGFDSASGWYATGVNQESSVARPGVENVCGRFKTENSKTSFVSIIEDYSSGGYSQDNTYDSYMKMSFYDNTQFVLNSGPKDNRSAIGNMAENEEWVLDYQIVDSTGATSTNFDFELGEYLYNTSTGGYQLRTGFITFETRTPTTAEAVKSGSLYKRTIFTVKTNNYEGVDDFKKNSKIYLKIKPKTVSATGATSQSWYIKKIALYRKSIGKDGSIVVPDYEETNSKSAEEFIESGALEKRYHYFRDWLVSTENSEAIVDKDKLTTLVRTSQNYNIFIPVYNTGAEKVRTVTAKESNYFNILQSIVETFEAWLELDVTRNDNGAIIAKKVKFKNYVGDNNYASFRYGVNLKDISRTCDSKNITTKLIVKTNSNELAENGFCTIQRAGANPTGENYIYDFQYYQSQGIMDTSDYLSTVYYIDGAKGGDSTLWDGGEVESVSSTEDTNLNGYYLRLKKINDSVIPIADEVSGLRAELVQKKALKEVATATKEASITGMEQSREDFYILTGIYPEDAQDTAITSIAKPQTANLWADNKVPDMIVPQENWWSATVDPETGIDNTNHKITGTITLNEHWGAEDQDHEGVSVKYDKDKVAGTNFTKDNTEAEKWGGVRVKTEWEDGRAYALSYIFKLTEDMTGTNQLLNFGCHNVNFKGSKTVTAQDETETITFKIHVEGKHADGTKKSWDSSAGNTICEITNWTPAKNDEYHVFVTAVRNSTSTADDNDNKLWIQPNRGTTTAISGRLSNIRLQKWLTSTEAVKDKDQIANFFLNLEVKVNSGSTVARTYQKKMTIPANTSSITFEQSISATDLTRSDVKKYMTSYVTFEQEKKDATEKETKLTPEITALEQSIKLKDDIRKQYLEYKRHLNELFFKKYSRYITEGTWISEEYTDDDKYYADAQSVLYNSCYPQISYTVNVLFLSRLPEYELLQFNLGDTTYVIDEDFFGKDHKQEVIITEISETLDDPTKDSIKVQTYKTQFQDLFQRITATVQQAQYNNGAYEKNNALFEANTQKQAAFLQNILNSADTYLQAGATVETDNKGILITNEKDPKRQLRLTGGAILLSAEDPKTQEQVWRTGLTNEGISADLITAGRLDAGAVQIMSGDEPVFRWDAYGISAYDATWNTVDGISTISGINSKKFVRFDKFGVYGVNNSPGIDGQSWHPASNDDIDKNAAYHLTWDGLKVTPENMNFTAKYTEDGTEKTEISKPHDYRIKLGRVDENLYNDWDANTGYPKYTPGSQNKKFVKVMSVGDVTESSVSENFVLYSDGTLVAENIKLPGSIQWTDGSSPSKNVYGTDSKSAPAAGTLYGSFEDDDDATTAEVEWHKVYKEGVDTYYCHTDNGGATWQGPFLITGKSIVDTHTNYAAAIAGTDPSSIKSWVANRPDLSDVDVGYNLYTKTWDEYNNGTTSSPRYSVEEGRKPAVYLSTNSLIIPCDNDDDISPAILADRGKITVYVKDGAEDISSRTDIDYYWTLSEGDEYETNDNGNELTITSLSGNYASANVIIQCGTMIFGNLTCIIQVIRAESYISSSRGNVFDESAEGTVNLTANLIVGLEEIDPNEEYFTYTWYKEKGDNDEILKNGDDAITGKTITVNVSDIIGCGLYFTATPKTAEQQIKEE